MKDSTPLIHDKEHMEHLTAIQIVVTQRTYVQSKRSVLSVKALEATR